MKVSLRDCGVEERIVRSLVLVSQNLIKMYVTAI